ncbi:MAG: TlpA disulfide reductase family protein [Methylovulum sp.]|nr:TlpA disulfide reductase family protein [Methylovulum sp.]
MKQAVIIILVAILALVSGVLAKNFLSVGTIGEPMALPTFSLPDLAGKQHSIEEWQGKMRVINFWGTWCPPCRKEVPEFIALQQDYSARGLVVIGIAIDDAQAVAEYSAEAKINYPLLMAPDEGIALSHQLGNDFDAVPFTVIVDQQGTIIYRHPGALSKEQVLAVVSPFLP